MRARRYLGIFLFGLVAGCGNLMCDQDKKESINHMNLGIDAAKARAFETAEKELETATGLDPSNHQAAYALGQVYADQRKWDKAIDAFSMAAKHFEDPVYHYKLGQALYEQDKLDGARKEFEKAIEGNKRLFKAHWYLGRIHARQERPKEAAQELTEACKLNPGFGKPFVDLGKLYYKWDYLNQAVSVLSQGAQYGRDAEDTTNIYYYLGMAYDGLKQYDKAAEAYESAIKAKKDNVEARLQLGMAYANKGDKDNAKKFLNEFIKMGGGNNAFNIQAANERLSKLASN